MKCGWGSVNSLITTIIIIYRLLVQNCWCSLVKNLISDYQHWFYLTCHGCMEGKRFISFFPVKRISFFINKKAKAITSRNYFAFCAFSPPAMCIRFSTEHAMNCFLSIFMLFTICDYIRYVLVELFVQCCHQSNYRNGQIPIAHTWVFWWTALTFNKAFEQEVLQF